MFTAKALRQQLLVMGNMSDQVDLVDGTGTAGWTKSRSNASIDKVWNHDISLATLYVKSGMTVI